MKPRSSVRTGTGEGVFIVNVNINYLGSVYDRILGINNLRMEDLFWFMVSEGSVPGCSILCTQAEHRGRECQRLMMDRTQRGRREVPGLSMSFKTTSTATYFL